MNKEEKSKLLQAITDLREDAKNHIPYHTEYLNERLDTIENVITNYFVYKQDYERVMKEKNSLLKEYAKSQDKLKALEIIKDCLVSEFKLFEKDGEYFILFYFDELHELTFRLKNKEEYDLLKEVLL